MIMGGRASIASRTLSGVTNGNWSYIYIYIWFVRPQFSSVGMALCNVGEVKCQPF